MSYYGRYSDDEDYDDGYYYQADSYGEDSDSDEYEYEEDRGLYSLNTPTGHHASAPPVAEAQAAIVKLKYRKRKKWTHTKHPDMPKRCRSAYSLFFVKNRPGVKDRLGGASAKATEIVSVVADMWRKTSDEEKQLWEQEAVKDRERYYAELAAYTGPTKIECPPKRTITASRRGLCCLYRKKGKKAAADPSKPKRSPSAFLVWTQTVRPEMRKHHPGKTNQEISKMLGEMWRKLSEEEQRPYQARARELAVGYRDAMQQYVDRQLAARAAEEAKVTNMGTGRWACPNNWD